MRFKKELFEHYNIDLDNVLESDRLMSNIQEAVDKLREYSYREHEYNDRFEVILNNNLIECKDTYTQFRTIIGCKISYADLDKEISFIVRKDIKPSYEELEKENIQMKEMLSSLKEMIKIC